MSAGKERNVQALQRQKQAHLPVRKRSRFSGRFDADTKAAVCFTDHELVVGTVTDSTNFQASFLEHLRHVSWRESA